MAQIFGLTDIQERKRALVAESEIYRQTLKLEVQNIKLYGVRLQRRFAIIRLTNPLLLLVGSFVSSKLLGLKPRVKRRGKWSLVGLALLALRLFRNYGPLVQGLVAQRILRRREDARSPERPATER